MAGCNGGSARTPLHPSPHRNVGSGAFVRQAASRVKDSGSYGQEAGPKVRPARRMETTWTSVRRYPHRGVCRRPEGEYCTLRSYWSPRRPSSVRRRRERSLRSPGGLEEAMKRLPDARAPVSGRQMSDGLAATPTTAELAQRVRGARYGRRGGRGTPLHRLLSTTLPLARNSVLTIVHAFTGPRPSLGARGVRPRLPPPCREHVRDRPPGAPEGGAGQA